jgi:hypothetical protein
MDELGDLHGTTYRDGDGLGFFEGDGVVFEIEKKSE